MRGGRRHQKSGYRAQRAPQGATGGHRAPQTAVAGWTVLTTAYCLNQPLVLSGLSLRGRGRGASGRPLHAPLACTLHLLPGATCCPHKARPRLHVIAYWRRMRKQGQQAGGRAAGQCGRDWAAASKHRAGCRVERARHLTCAQDLSLTSCSRGLGCEFVRVKKHSGQPHAWPCPALPASSLPDASIAET